MVEFRTTNSIFKLNNFFIKEIRTSDDLGQVKEWLDKYSYHIECRDETGHRFTIDFVSSDAYIIPKWISYQFSQEKVDEYSSELHTEINIVTSHAERNLLQKCKRIKDFLQKDECFGINVIRFGDPTSRTSSFIQIVDFWEYENEHNPIYYKGGAWTEKEKPIKISEYRHMLEWKPTQSKLKLTNLGIGPGQKYAKDAFLIFELSYDDNDRHININNIKPNKEIVDTWLKYVRYNLGHVDSDFFDEIIFQIEDYT